LPLLPQAATNAASTSTSAVAAARTRVRRIIRPPPCGSVVDRHGRALPAPADLDPLDVVAGGAADDEDLEQGRSPARRGGRPARRTPAA
jgi:hypothetical protein